MGGVRPAILAQPLAIRNKSDRQAGIEASVSEAGRMDIQHVEPLSDARTPFGERCVPGKEAVRQPSGRVGENRECFSPC